MQNLINELIDAVSDATNREDNTIDKTYLEGLFRMVLDNKDTSSRYFSKVSNNTQCKNKLEQAVQDYVRTKNRKIISAEDVQDFKNEINTKIGLLNAEHPRCKPVIPSWWQPYDDKSDWSMHLYFINITLYQEAI